MMEIANYVLALLSRLFCYRAVQGQGLLVAGISVAKRIEGCQEAAFPFKANICQWYNNEVELSYFICFMGKSCPLANQISPCIHTGLVCWV